MKSVEKNQLVTIDLSKYTMRSSSRFVSPFRYPGGKGFFSNYLLAKINELDLAKNIILAEPFCGGAGASLNLLRDGHIEKLKLNDADLRIYSAWRAILEEADKLISCISSAKLNLEEWHEHRENLLRKDHSGYSFELGFSTLYLNRTTHSGIIDRSGPIGGYQQKGKWKIDARFNKDNLIERISWLASKRDSIQLSNFDGIDFIVRMIKDAEFNNTFMFIDPPYVGAGDSLYKNTMNEAKHVILSEILQNIKTKNWILTYDDAPLIRELYKKCELFNFTVNYSLREKRKENEILALPV